MYVIPVSKVFARDKNIKHDMVCQHIEFGYCIHSEKKCI